MRVEIDSRFYDGDLEIVSAFIPGLTAEEYLRESIVDPDAYVVDGFPAGQMLPHYLDILSDEDIDNLVAFLLTLE